MSRETNLRMWVVTSLFLLVQASSVLVYGADWKNQIVYPNDPFCSPGISENDPLWVKFTIKLDEPNTVYFQDSQLYVLHYNFATALLEPFIGMTREQFDQVTLFDVNQLAVLGVVFMPPTIGEPPVPAFAEYGIQFVRYDPYTKEEIRDLFNVVKSKVSAEPGIEAFYFPSYEQFETAEENRDWFESEGIPISSTARWAEGNLCYSEGWALGELKFFTADNIHSAYQNGLLEPNDILLTDATPAEIPFVAGIISLSPSTPSSHVAILAQTYRVPFVYLALAEDANRAQQLIGHKIAFRAYEDKYGGYDVRLIDVEGVLDEATITEILALQKPVPLDISPIAYCGAYSANTDVLTPNDVNHFGGKGSNFGILRTSIPDNSPVATVLSFDLWNEFLDQPITPRESIVMEPGGYKLFWADNEQEQGPTHASFGLSKNGFEDIGLFHANGTTLIDSTEQFPPQGSDVSYGRSPDGNDNWVYFTSGTTSPNQPNGGTGGPTEGLFINEFMADNDNIIQDDFGDYDDWIEIYNAGPIAVDLGGMYLTDDINDPTEWMIPFGITGSTLREEIANRLSKYTYPPTNMAVLSEDLSAIRNLFKNSYITSFTQAQIQAIENILQDTQYGFDENRKIRFRSSTNVEDSERFTGAGLYDSYSGCLADDLDGDDDGPCACDPCEDNERGVFRAIRKVFASFYNDNAFLERLRYDVNEGEVGMAVLVHHSFPDEIELSNGVATLSSSEGTGDKNIMLVTQLGATSVANPEGGSIPEEVSVYVGPYGIYPTLVRWSSLVPIGETVMEWEDDYNDLSQLLVDAAEKFEQVTGKSKYFLDFEYKKVAPGGTAMPAGGLVVKQIREIPQPDTTPSITPFLINEPTEYCIFQGEGENVFARHRLKSRWTFETKNIWLNGPNLAESLYAEAHIEYVDSGRIRTLTGTLPLLPFAYHNFDGTDANDGWRMHHLANPRDYEVQTENIPLLVSPAESPLLTLRDLGYLSVDVEYDQPVQSGPTTNTTTDTVVPCPCPQPEADDVFAQYNFYDEVNDVNITTSFYLLGHPGGIIIWTAPLSRFVETIIEGCTTEPIVLHSYYSQTYGAAHHGVCDYLLFEPRLEPGISQDILDELKAKNIRLIYKGLDGSITTYGFEDESFIPGDFEPDGDVDFLDFCLLAKRWLETGCDACGKADLNGDGEVDMADLHEFTESWLWEQ